MTQAAAPELNIPPELQLPKVAASELACVSDEAYRNLKLRDELQKQRIKTLENIIKTTRGDK